jgi:arylsulfatase A-like enzyme
MAEVFRQAGYDTAYLGKWHLDGHGRSAYIPPERRQGFDYWKAAECDHDYNHSHYYAGNSPEKQFWPGYDAFAQTADAQRWLRGRTSVARPFLLVVAYGPPHYPHASAPKEYRDLYPPQSLKLPPNVPEAMQEAARREMVGYYAHCTALDKCLGDLVATLDETGLADDTILVFTSDHGEMMGAQGQAPFGKQRPWDESIRVPLVLRDPRLQAQRARTVTTPIDTPDLLPTLLGLTGIPIPGTIEGENLAAVIRSGADGPDRAALVMNVAPFADNHAGKEYRGIRTRRWTFVRGLEGPWLLYDNEADPQQMRNLVGLPAQAAVQRALEAQLQARLRRIGDEFHPRAWYLKKWGYQIDAAGCIPYGGKAVVQSPGQKQSP